MHAALRPQLPELVAIFASAAERSVGYTEAGGARSVDLAQWMSLAARCGAADGAARRAFDQCAEQTLRASTGPAVGAGPGGGGGRGGSGGGRGSGGGDGAKRLRLPGYFSGLLRLAFAAGTATEDRRRGKSADAAGSLRALLAQRWMRSSDLFKGLDQDGSGLVNTQELTLTLTLTLSSSTRRSSP